MQASSTSPDIATQRYGARPCNTAVHGRSPRGAFKRPSKLDLYIGSAASGLHVERVAHIQVGYQEAHTGALVP